MLLDLPKTIKASLYERTASPLVGGYCLYWLIVNWRVVLILCSGESAANKIDHISTINHDAWVMASNNIIVPVALSIASALALPFATFVLLWPYYKAQSLIEGMRDKFENNRRLTLDQSRLYRDELNKSQEALASTISRNRSDIEDARLRNSELASNVNGLNSQLEDKKKEIGRISGNMNIMKEANDALAQIETALKKENEGLKDQVIKLKSDLEAFHSLEDAKEDLETVAGSSDFQAHMDKAALYQNAKDVRNHIKELIKAKELAPEGMLPAVLMEILSFYHSRANFTSMIPHLQELGALIGKKNSNYIKWEKAYNNLVNR